MESRGEKRKKQGNKKSAETEEKRSSRIGKRETQKCAHEMQLGDGGCGELRAATRERTVPSLLPLQSSLSLSLSPLFLSPDHQGRAGSAPILCAVHDSRFNFPIEIN